MMKSHRSGSATFLQRLRSTPKNIRRRFKTSKSEDASNVPDGRPMKMNVMTENNNVLKRNLENEQLSFNCKYLGKRAVYTLKPEDCYEFALDLASSVADSSSKVTLNLESKYLELTYQSSSPSAKQKLKLSQQASLSMFRLNTATRTSSRPVSACIDTPTTVFDATCRPVSTDDSILHSAFGRNESNNSSIYGNSLVPHEHLPEVNGHRERSRTFSGLPDNNQTVDSLPVLPDPEKILLHEIAYCVTVPERPRVFLVTSKGREGLVCRVFMFANKEKSQGMKLALANQFKNSYLEWQSKMSRRNRRFSSSGNVVNTTTEAPAYSVIQPHHPHELMQSKKTTNVKSKAAFHAEDEDQSSSDDDIFSSTEKAAMHREFTRRASCLASPETLLASELLSNLSLEQNLPEKLSDFSDCSTDSDFLS